MTKRAANSAIHSVGTMHERRAFVTGAAGFLGLNLVAALRERGWRVTAMHRASSDLRYLSRFDGIERVIADLADRESLRRTVPEGVDAVFHVAGNLNFWSRRNEEQYRDNVVGTRHVVEAALARSARCLVYTSSIAAYGIHGRTPIAETAERRGLRSSINYLRTKALAEEEVRAGIARGLRAVIVNPANIVGPYDRRGWASMIRLACAGKLPFAPPGRGSFCHVREVARAHIEAVERGRTGENYLLGGADATYLEFVRTIGDVCNCKVPRRAAPYLVLWLMARVAVSWAALAGRPPLMTPEAVKLACSTMTCRSDKAIRELGYRPVALRAMVEDAYRWLREEGWIRR